MRFEDKIKRLQKIIFGYGSCAIAFSGGVDSTFLLKIASLVLPKSKLLAVTADSPTYPPEELRQAKEIARRLKIRHAVIKTKELKDRRFSSNPVNRCYFCKKELFSKMHHLASKYRITCVVDASNLSDAEDFRPGSIARKELNVRSPLVEAGFTKDDIRRLSRRLGLYTWNKPNLACLASRIPYGQEISVRLLKRIHTAENYLKKMGFRQVRLRHYGSLCRIEVGNGEIYRLFKKRERIVDRLKELGYNYITADLEGYRVGSLNEVIRNE
ncbi:MAG: ATP-dependent sacrificial sulfur transferase LarE [Candidatus Omnitrophica bacterium]|nr:ATP-dependent sacrificial sulfur transferase LarE [Candidatus Omnitrophota bacterium]